jgi:glyoxylase I family protein
MQIDRCLHTAILVSDLAAAEQFYGIVLGLPKVDRVLKFPGAWYQVGDYQIHLIADSSNPPPFPSTEKWGRNAHIAFSVVDLAAAKARLLAHGCPIQASNSGRAALFVRDPDGNVVELSEV